MRGIAAMKVNRHGKAKILTPEEIRLLFNRGLTNLRDRALFAVCLFCAVRINEACTLHTKDVYDRRRRVREALTFRKCNTKRKLSTRTIPVADELRRYLEAYRKEAGPNWLFPGGPYRNWDRPICPDSASRILRETMEALDIQGSSTQSFRRTALTLMSDRGVPLRVIQEISGHRSLQQLQEYLEVTPEQVRGAVHNLSLLSPVAPLDGSGAAAGDDIGQMTPTRPG
ncbi:site-specific integrase [Lyngbya sp. CCY1209]|uniref:tyrosine-type recombinase/integrase n=1 Tax=Lyngbya sp. CCY1209 TaxID=2886103 RepID=UPI002D216D68|nr:site-specific integrase [Lyngbya sp. CCY1209]MEB3882810.1 site-specific integrase [Lyngbya sp. CCY1209]